MFADGAKAEGSFEGETPQTLRFVVQGERLALKAITRMEFPRSSPVVQNSKPLRVVHLNGGESITAEWLKFADDQVRLLWQGKEIALPSRAVLAIEHLPTERQVVFEDFDAPELAPHWKAIGAAAIDRVKNRQALKFSGQASMSLALDQPIGRGRVSAAFLDPEPESNTDTASLELNFGDETNSQTLTIELASAEATYGILHSPNIKLTRQAVRRNSGWHQVAVVFDEARFQVLLDSHLLGYGRPPRVPLKSLRLVAKPTEGSMQEPAREFWLDAVQVSRFITEQNRPNPISQGSQSQVLLEGGESFYGKLVAVDSREVRLQGAFGELAWPWDQVRRVTFAKDNAEKHPPLIGPALPTGWQADVTFQRFADHPRHPADRISATILKANAGAVTIAHPWLGTHEIPVSQLDVIAPKFLGPSWILSSDAMSLGNQATTDSPQDKSAKSYWHGEVDLKSAPIGSAFLRASAWELEPAGQGTPPGSPHLSELRNGGLGTEILLNGTSLGRLNDQITRKADHHSPQEIRLAIPPGLLKAGQNTWAIRQTPTRSNPQQFDDCEIGPIVLEVEQASHD